MTTPGPAQRWAQQQTAGRPIRWKGLEIAAFSAHRRVVRALGPTREDKRQGRPVRWWLVLVIPFALVAALVLFYPAGAFVLLADGRTGRFDIDGIDASIALPLAGSLLLVGGVVHLLMIRQRQTRGAFDSGLDGVAVVFGAFDALVIGRRGSSDDVAGWPWWLAIALLVVLVGAAGFVHGLRLREPAARTMNEPRTSVRRQVAKLSDAERDAVRRDLDAAVADLAARGLITRKAAEKAGSADLGMLSIAVS